MHTTAIVLALALAAPLTLTACSKKSAGTSAPAPSASTVALVVPRCPAGSSLDGTNCKATGMARVATLAWNNTIGDTTQVLTLRNLSGMGMKNATVSIWFYDKSGTRLDVAGAKKYAVPGDAFGTPVRVGESRDLTINLAKTSIPDGTAEIEAEVVKVSLVNRDGTDGNTWTNDDLNSDDRAMAGNPATTAIVPMPRPVVMGRPGHRPAPPPPPHH
jgi:hypothetical protein